MPQPRFGRTCSSKYSFSSGSRIFPAIFSGRPVSRATSIARWAPLSWLQAAEEEEVVAAMGLHGIRASRSSAFGQFAIQGRSGLGLRWFSESEISPTLGDTRAICS